MATEGSRSSNSSVDSYIGSLISLTSKSEIRYEGILYNINTEESSIGLTNVRSFGTEGRKKDGTQVNASDKVYEYILFRGSDIKDLQVKSTQPVQPAQPINSDPAIIQSHYPRPTPTTSSTFPSIASDSLSTPSTYTPHLGQPGSTFQGGMPLYQPGGTVGSWGPSPPPPNPNPSSSGIAMPMYWPGYYTPPQNALQQSLPRPPQGLGMPSLLQQPMQQYSSFNASLPTGQPNTSASSATLTSNSLLGPTLPSLQTPPSGGSLQPEANAAVNSSDVNVGMPPIMPNALSGARFPYTSSVGGGPVVPTEPPTPSLVTPGQLLQSVPGSVAPSQPPQPPSAVQNDVEVVQVMPASSSPSSVPVPVPVATEPQPPILPLPPQTQVAQKPNGSIYQNRSNYSYRGRERGRASGGSQTVMKFTEEFDFTAMNEKFNKDEVWGSLGKKEKGENATEDDDSEEETIPNLPKIDVKPVYSKDDFFDTLSSNTTDRQSNYGRTRFSEQMKLDTETFGEFSRYRGGGRGGRGPYRGGRSRGGGYYGRGGGYGYVGRGGRGGGRNTNASNDY